MDKTKRVSYNHINRTHHASLQCEPGWVIFLFIEVISILTPDIHLKEPKTFEEQLEILKGKNLIIEDEEKALNFLKKIKYYRFSAYGLTLKESDKDIFRDGVTFRQLEMIYNFDKRLRELFIYYLESVEIEFRTKIAYYHAHDYGALGYKKSEYFNNEKYHTSFLTQLEKDIHKSSKELFVIHHKEKYNGLFPFWVAIEVTSFGDLSRIYRNLLRNTKIKIIQHLNISPETVASWLHTLSYVRNVCAHYGRLYGKGLVIKPSLKEYKSLQIDNRTIFAVVFVLTKLLDRNDCINFIIGLEVLMEEFSDYINLKEIGFPTKWQEVLKNGNN